MYLLREKLFVISNINYETNVNQYLNAGFKCIVKS
jgi:hypothetical protein